MNIITHPTRTTEINHPAWCDPRYCNANTVSASADVGHSSTPQSWTAVEDDVEVTVSLQRHDERHIDDNGLTPHLSGAVVALRNTCGNVVDDAEPAAEVFLNLADAEHLAIQLMEHVVKARAALGGDVA